MHACVEYEQQSSLTLEKHDHDCNTLVSFSPHFHKNMSKCCAWEMEGVLYSLFVCENVCNNFCDQFFKLDFR